MPTTPPHPCPGPHCGRLTRTSHCPRCTRRLEQARGTSRQRGYGPDWAIYSVRWLALHRWCGERQDFRLYAEHSRCVQQGLRTPADVTDHIVSLRDGGARLDPTNHQSLCYSCNTRKG